MRAHAMLAFKTHGADLSFEVRVTPRSSRSEIRGVTGSALKVNLSAPPVDGAANVALCELLAEVLGVPRRAVEISHGLHAKRKTVRVSGLSLETLRARLEAAAS